MNKELLFEKLFNSSKDLLIGQDLYKKVTAERVEGAFPDLIKMFQRAFKNRNGSSSRDSDMILNGLLNFFASSAYNRFISEFSYGAKFIDRFCPKLEMFRSASQITWEGVANNLEEFRKFSLTAKQIVPLDELRGGEVLYSHNIVITNDTPIKYILNAGRMFNENLNYSIQELPSWRMYVCVIGWTKPINLERLVNYAIGKIKANSMEEWMNLLKSASLQFENNPFIEVVRENFLERKYYEGIAPRYHEALRNSFINWYFDHMEEVVAYYRKKNDSGDLLSIDLSHDMQYKIRERFVYNLVNEINDPIVIKHKGKLYRLDKGYTFIDSQINKFIRLNPNDSRIKNIVLSIKSDYIYQEKLRDLPSDYISDQYEEVKQLQLF